MSSTYSSDLNAAKISVSSLTATVKSNGVVVLASLNHPEKVFPSSSGVHDSNKVPFSTLSSLNNLDP